MERNERSLPISARGWVAVERAHIETAERNSESNLARELEDTQRVQEVSSLLIEGPDDETLYGRILEAAMAIMRADFASIQRFDLESNELHLIGHRNFHPDSAKLWERVSITTGTTCGGAMRERQRTFSLDVSSYDPNISEGYHWSGSVSVQSTPLISRDGRLIGVLSTHWRTAYAPAEADYRWFDVLARQTADAFERTRVEQALQDSEARLAATFDAMPLGVGLTNAKGRLVLSNKEMQRFLPTGIIPSHDDRFERWVAYDADGRRLQRHQFAVARALRGETVVPGVETLYTQDDGRKVWNRVAAVPVKNHEGVVSGAIMVISDIDVLKRTAEALQAGEKRLRTVLEQAPLAVAFTGPSGEIQFRNAMFDTLWGRPAAPADPAAKACAYSDAYTGYHLDGRLVAADEWPGARALATGEIAEGDLVEIVQPDGKRVTCWSAAAPIRDEAGGIAGSVVLFRDITEERRAQEALRHSEERYRMLFDASPFPFIVTKPDAPHFTVIGVNDAYLSATMRTRAALVGQRLFEEFPDIPNRGVSSVLRPSFERVLATRQRDVMPVMKYDIERPDGTFEERWWTPVQSPVLDDNGEVAAIIHCATDVTDIHRAGAALRASEERQTFLLTLSDALRPLTSAVAIQATTTRLLGSHLDADRVLFAEVEGATGAEAGVVSAQYIRPAGAGQALVAPFPERFVYRAFGAHTMADRYRGELLVVADIDARPDFAAAERAAWVTAGVRAAIVVPLARGGQLLAELGVHSATPRDWTEEEISLVRDVAERTLVASECAHAAKALQASETRYRTLFESIDEGFCIIELIFDEAGKAVDYLFREVNPAFAKQTGWIDAVGKTARAFAPALEQFWFDIYGRVAQTGQPERFEHHAGPIGRWFNVFAFRVGKPAQRRVAVLFGDIDERKHRELQIALLDQVGRDLARLSGQDDIMHAVGARIGEHLGLAECLVVDVDEAADETTVHYVWEIDHVPGTEQSFKLRDSMAEEFARSCRAGEAVIVGDTNDDTSDDARGNVALHAAQPVGAFAVIPFHSAGRWTGYLALTHRVPRHWRSDEIRLLKEVAERLFLRIERARADSALHYSSERMRKIVTQAATGVLQTDEQGCITLLNQKFCSMIGHTEAELLGRNFVDLMAPESMRDTMDAIERLAVGGSDLVLEEQFQRRDGSRLWANCSINAVRGPDGKFQGLVAIVIDVSDRKQAEDRERHASLHDPLTGLPNRAMLFEYARHILSHDERHHRNAALMFIDLDRFKPINDTHGHETGDAVLRDVAARLVASLRAEDIVARLGGDEFVVLLQHIDSAAYAAEVARHLLAHLSQPYHIGTLELSLSASIGIAIFPDDGDTVDALVSHADMAMYRVKQNGRNDFQFSAPEYAAIALQQIAIEQQLRNALNGEAFDLCYQPILDLQTGRVVSAEALLRLRHGDTGPERFIPIAEATGLIHLIGKWVTRQALRQHRAWLAAGLPPIPISVNVSVVELRDREFASKVRATLEEEGVDPAALQLEITETAVMENIDHAIGILTELKALGIKILLDDFGTGYSSLAYVARLPLNKLKIDKSFILPSVHNRVPNRAVTHAMVALGRALELDVVAEGVESEEALAFVNANGCNQAQGFHLGCPLEGGSFVDWLSSREVIRL